MTRILEKSRPKISLLDYSAEKIDAFLKTKLQAHNIQQAYLFGSYVQGKATSWSDLDLLIVMPTDLPFLERARIFDDLFDLGFPVDILVYTPDEFVALSTANQGFWRCFQEHHRRLV